MLHNRPFEPLELYNLANDPLETTDEAQAETARFREMSQLFQAETQKAGHIPWQK